MPIDRLSSNVSIPNKIKIVADGPHETEADELIKIENKTKFGNRNKSSL